MDNLIERIKNIAYKVADEKAAPSIVNNYNSSLSLIHSTLKDELVIASLFYENGLENTQNLLDQHIAKLEGLADNLLDLANELDRVSTIEQA